MQQPLRDQPKWHPIIAAIEPEPGVWYMVDSLDECYGVIRIVRIGEQVGYRAVTWAANPASRELIGYYRSLRGSAEAVHQRFMSGVGPKLPTPTPTGSVQGRARP